MKFSKKLVTGICIFLALFIIAVFYSFIKVGSEPSTLIGSVFLFATGELWALAFIKKSEGKEENKDE